MSLTEPVSSSFQQISFAVILVRQIHLFQSSPALFSLFRCIFRMIVYFMLEMVYQHAIRQEFDCRGKMGESVLVLIFLKEQSDPWPGIELHAHGMDLSRFHGRPLGIHYRNVAAAIVLESVSCFVSQNIHVSAGTIEVGKDERNLVVRK